MIREPAVAGVFYPFTKNLLIEKIENCLKHPLGPKEVKKEDISAGVVPHAGYDFSGPCAAWFYSKIPKKKFFIILGPNHTGLGRGVSIMSSGSWRTPLGEVEIESDIAKEILNSLDFVKEDPLAHLYEHSIEVQLPFLQYFIGDFTFVPIVVSREFYHPKYMERLGSFLREFEDDIILIASSDFTHYGPFYGYYPYGIGKEAHEKVVKKDLEVISKILEKDIEGFYNLAKDMTICGYGPIIAVMAFSEGEGKLLKYYTSYEITGDLNNWVGYASIAFY